MSNIKLFYSSSSSNGTQIHLHHHHHHIYHHSNSGTSIDQYSKQLNENRSSPYGSQVSLSLVGTTNGSSQGYHSISASPTITTVENLNKENLRTPLSFTNPLFNDQYLAKQDQQDSDTDYEDHSNPADSSKALYFLNNLCIESQQDPSPPPPPPPLVHSTSRQSFQQQPLFVLNNGYMTQNNQSLPSTSSSKPPPTTTYYYLKTNEEFPEQTRKQSMPTVHSQPPKMGVKALNHNPPSKVRKNSFFLLLMFDFRRKLFFLNVHQC